MQVMSSWKVPGVAVGVVRDDRVVYLKAFGDVTPDTLFEIASTSKAFTTAAMAMLVDEKKLSWDDPVRNTIPYFHLADPQADALVTLRDLVTHRTGLARHDELWDETSFSREEVIRRAGFAPLTKPIRTTYQYNNIMFALGGLGDEENEARTGEQMMKIAGGRPGRAPENAYQNYDEIVWNLQAERASNLADMESSGGIGTTGTASGAENLIVAQLDVQLHDPQAAALRLQTTLIDTKNISDVAAGAMDRALFAEEALWASASALLAP